MSNDLKRRSKYWCFTSFDLDRDYTLLVTTQKREIVPTYFIYGEEICPDTGRVHHQGYIEFDVQLSGTQLVKHWPGLHVEARIGTAEQAAAYCRKEPNAEHPDWIPNDVVVTAGVISETNQGSRTDIKCINTLIIERGQNVKDLVTSGLITNLQQLRFAEGLVKYAPVKRNWITDVYWFWGPTGVGKTRRAWDEAELAGGDTWCSSRDLQWWDGYSGQENVIIDDFRGDFCKFHELLRILDRYPYNVPIKGSFSPLLAKRIWITSPYRPEEVYQSESARENVGQLLRRITETTKIGKAELTVSEETAIIDE